MNELSADPYAGARQAYQVVYPNATDTNWDTWLANITAEANGQIDNFKAFAQLCGDAMASGVEITPVTAQHICYAEGWFDAMASVVASLLRSLPVSGSVPHHFLRYQASLINRDARFD